MIREPWCAEHLTPFPAVTLRLLRTLAAEDVDIPETCRVINSDPHFAAELLRSANSPLFGHSYKIGSIDRAVTALGLAYITKLAMTVALRTYLRKVLTTEMATRCWHHCLATALISADLAADFEQLPDNAYTAGLIHDIGRLALLQAFPAGYSLLLEECQQRQIDVREAERALLGGDHCMAGMWISAEWRLPTESYRVVWDHHEVPPDDERSLTALIHTACGLADRLGLGIFTTQLDPGDIIAWAPPRIRNYLERNIHDMIRDLPAKVQALANG